MHKINRNQIAWQIAYDLMVRSIEPLAITISNPDTEQHVCLDLRRSDDDNPANGISTVRQLYILVISGGMGVKPFVWQVLSSKQSNRPMHC